jgi:hypothetical protein
LPIDYNILFYLEGRWDRLWGDESSRIFIANYQGDSIEYPVIVNGGGGWGERSCNLVIFKRSDSDSVILDKYADVNVSVIRWDGPMSFFAGGGLLGWGMHKLEGGSKYYLFSWYKILHTKRLLPTANIARADDYLRYYYYYQHII